MLDRIDVKYFKLAVGLDAIGKETDVDISCRCPICGDSQKNKRSKRLHLYTKQGFDGSAINCFNGDCSCQNKTMYSFLRDHYPSLLPQYKREQFGTTMNKLANGGNVDVFSKFKKPDPKPKKEVLTQDLSSYMKPIQDSYESLEYIKKRGFDYNNMNYGDWFFGYQDLKIGETLYKITNSIVIPLYYNNEMYGFYSRNISNKTFYTYMHDANVGYKIWNWFNVDKSKPVYIFEGIFDAIASGLDNVIALMGAKLPETRLSELYSPVFVLDNDKTGLLNSLSYSKRGYNVYIQPDKFVEKDMNELLLSNKVQDLPSMIKTNCFKGILAEVKIKSKL